MDPNVDSHASDTNDAGLVVRRLLDMFTHEESAVLWEASGTIVTPYCLMRGDRAKWDSRGHFFAAAAVAAMTRMLVERARKELAQQRGGDRVRVELSHVGLVAGDREDWLLELDEALQRLTQIVPLDSRNQFATTVDEHLAWRTVHIEGAVFQDDISLAVHDDRVWIKAFHEPLSAKCANGLVTEHDSIGILDGGIPCVPLSVHDPEGRVHPNEITHPIHQTQPMIHARRTKFTRFILRSLPDGASLHHVPEQSASNSSAVRDGAPDFRTPANAYHAAFSAG
ncbi:MAG: ECF-type sigma factor [Pirellulaceae bacterium]|jgi:hypothetical protein|nr:ECF-type sigma factor [Pirellulaceae bacterium]